MFGAKRKARKIQVSEENDDPPVPASAGGDSTNDASKDTSPSSIKFTRRPAKSSSLRKSININDSEDATTSATAAGHDDDDNNNAPAVIRPAVSRSGSTRLKKKGSSSRLSFGVSDDASDATGDTEPPPAAAAFTTPKKPSSLSQRAAENSAFRAASGRRTLPTRSFGAERDRPSYSAEYLAELQSSTPSTPALAADEAMHDLDAAAELEGAVVVPAAEVGVAVAGGAGAGRIPSAAEIREKKERRARMALEGDAYEDEEEDYISLQPKKKKDESRLIAEDEDLGEGYDEFVEDGRLELGKKGEREAQRRHRREMEEMINAAEGASEDEDSDSDIERKAAYEAAQTRAAMDGLHRVAAEQDDGLGAGVARFVIPKMRPLPELASSLARMKELVQGMEEQVSLKKARIEAVEKEKKEILDREKEVQEVLNQAGLKYQSAIGIMSDKALDPETLAAQSPLNPGAVTNERGLDNFGTPSRDANGDTDMEG